MNRHTTFLIAAFLTVMPALALGATLEDAGQNASKEPASGQCPVPDSTSPLPQNKEVHTRATVLIGADVLGRIAIAADYDRDGIVDEEMLFTTTTRLKGPQPVLLKNAEVITRTSSVVVVAGDRSLAVAVSVSGEPHVSPSIPRSWQRYSQVVIDQDGIALSRKVRPETQKQPLSAYDHYSLYTWYPGFEKDMLHVGTGQCLQPGCAGVGCNCNDSGYGCTNGGCGAASCPCASPCSGGSQSCGGGYWACCICTLNLEGAYQCFSNCYPCGQDQ